MPISETEILERMRVEVDKALKALGGYKFWMFGYHAANWVNLNKLLDPPRAPNPFRYLVHAALFMQSDTAVLREKDVWREDKRLPREDWAHEVADNDTSLGYWEWVHYQIEAGRLKDS